MAPSSLLFYVGLNKKVDGLLHHNLFFDKPFAPHAEEIYTNPKWPSDPLFYVSCPSKTDSTVAPEGHENLFLLIPIAPDLEDSDAMREKYFDLLITRIEQHTGTSIKDNIVYKRSFCISDFKNDYHAFKGNAYGLANTLRQTAFLKPKIKNKKLNNLLYTGQLTVPGPGVPPSIISGEVVANKLIQEMKDHN
jgi:phytoene desaturase